MSSSSSAAVVTAKICFNSQCKEPLPDPPSTRRKGWRLRSGEIADLCDRCSCSFEQGNFCESFHSDDGGWRNCETCGKRVHCGCVVSVSTYVLLDAGGVDCVACARKSLVMAPNQVASSPMFMSQQAPERREFPAKSWKPVSGPIFGQWRQAPHMWNMTSAQSDLQQRLSYEFDRPNCVEKLAPGGRYSILAHEKKFENISEKPITGNLNNVARERYANGKVGIDAASTFGAFRGEGNADRVQDSCRLVGDSDSVSTRKSVNADPCSTSSSGANLDAHPNSCVNSLPSSAIKEDSSSLGLPAVFQSTNGSKEPTRFSANQSQSQTGPLSKQFYPPSVIDPEVQSQMRNGKTRAYFPTISQPEGLPLKVQDASGKDWVFQFRYWPNNNSRMYVLEGVTPCIQAMQLQAGDTVTFSRIDPEGKLIMGFRKASCGSSEQDSQAVKSGNGFSTPPEIDNKGTTKDFKGNAESRNLINTPEQRNCSKFANEGVLQKDGLSARSSQGTRRKGGNLGSKSKRLRIENEDSMELKLTWEEAQQLLRPPPNCVPSVVLVEGHEFEEYEEAPVLGKRTYFTTNQSGENYQLAQCEDCSKWRRLPVDALLPSRWTCSNNTWDPERSLCSAAQELSLEQLAELIPSKTGAPKRSKVKVESDNIEVSDGLDTLANLAILGEGENLPPSSQPTTKHPRHRPGCTCIVCIQPPSGKGPKHKQSCTCNVCLTVKRRFRTLMLRREKRQSEKEAETARKQQKQQPNQSSPAKAQVSSDSLKSGLGVNNSPHKAMTNEEGISDEGVERRRASPSPLKAPQIDLNIQPEREEEPSPKSDSGSMMRLLQDAATGTP
ncbi:B3 domain-containing protein [Musa troglodytarum]|uniref:B3 domain-containing protein n=1 Tax=Musa troglodytarum TaxID=320322 RepID=A0A9E7FNB5_9LILI|nr:B3 domain-containing protein [Musa troglodytarum]